LPIFSLRRLSNGNNDCQVENVISIYYPTIEGPKMRVQSESKCCAIYAK
jgi:hypothetical protein